MQPIKKSWRLIIVIPLLLSGNLCNSQGLSTEGRDFWIGFMNNWLQDPNNPIILEIYISADSATTGMLTMPRNASFTPMTFNVVPGVTTKLTIPTSAMAQGTNVTENKGIHITTDEDVSVYAMNKRQYSADVATILPTFSLGNKYYVVTHWEDGNRNNNDNSNSEFLIVSISDGTEIEITPSVETLGGNAAGVPFTVKLNRGEIYEVQARGDLTGTKLLGTNGQQGGCQNFALFAGNQYTKVGKCDDPNGHDHLYAQQYPFSTWGKEFITVNYATRTGGDVIKILAAEDNTTVKLNSTVFILNEGEYQSFLLGGINTITADKPVAVGQFSRSMGCDNSLGDPFYILISPVEQMIEKITFNAPTIATVVNYSLSIITKASEVSGIKLDNNNLSGSFHVVPGDPTYAYAQIITTSGNHTLQSQGGFIAYIYGYGRNESFGYTAGASLENLNIEVNIANGSGRTLPSDSICLNDVAVFTPVVNGLNHFEWNFGDGSADVTDNKDPVVYKFNKEGKYVFTLKASLEGGNCFAGHEETYVKVLTVVNPKSKIIGPRSVCPSVTDVSYYAEKKDLYHYSWSIAGGTITENYGDSIVVDWGPTNANAYLKLQAENKLDCIGDVVTLPVKINTQLEPDAPFGPDTLCSSAMTNITYHTFPIINSSFTWQTKPEMGTISPPQGSNNITIDWSNYGIKKLWFYQTTTIDSVCAGTSDTLYIYIQRDPSPNATLLSDKAQYQVGEIVNLSITDIDTLYQLMNWNFGDDHTADTVLIEPAKHIYECSGTYNVTIEVYDTLGICPTQATATKPIEVLPVSFEMIQVTTAEENDSVIQVLWKTKNTDFLNQVLQLKRRTSSSTWNDIGIFDGKMFVFTDKKVSTSSNIYEYKLSQVSSCPDQDETLLQHNIVLNAESDNNLSANISWNLYDNWAAGVDQYEIYLRKDQENFTLINTTSATVFQYTYDSSGFDYCFRIKAIESGGNNAFSWSNIACAEFLPPVITYNVITPNNDNYNELFIIEGIEFYPNSILTIYNRWGHKVKEFEGYQNNWPTAGEAEKLSSGVYYYVLALRDSRAGHNLVKGPLSILK